MAVFTVHLPKVAAGDIVAAEKIVFLRDGFSTPAFLFGPLWLAWKRAFLPAGLMLAVFALVFFGAGRLGLSGETGSIVTLALEILLGFEGVRLVAWSLARRGYHESAVVFGQDMEEAEEAFFYQWSQKAAPNAQAAPDSQAPAVAAGQAGGTPA